MDYRNNRPASVAAGPFARDRGPDCTPIYNSGLGKPLKSILHGTPSFPIYLGTQTPLNIRMAVEMADGWLPMGFAQSDMPISAGLLTKGWPEERMVIDEAVAAR